MFCIDRIPDADTGFSRLSVFKLHLALDEELFDGVSILVGERPNVFRV